MAEIDLVVTDEQQALRETLREFFAEQTPLARLREAPGGFDRKVWAAVAELGLPAMLVPEEHSGLGQSARESWVMFTEAGRGLYGGPLLATVAATHALLLAGDDEACARYLPGIAEGTTVATVAADEQGRGTWRLPSSAATTASPDGEQWVISGSKTAVLAGHAADLVLVTAATSDGPALFAVDAGGDADPEGLVRTELESLDLSRPLARLDLDRVPARRLVGPERATEVLDGVLDRTLVAMAAEQAGGAEACLEMCVEYAKTRTQFDQPIGAFQAVAHLCVDMLARVERARASAQYAAAAQAAGSSEFAVAARVAAAYCGRAFREVTTATIHVHGGTGFTWEHDAHLYFKRAQSSRYIFGDAGRHREIVAVAAGIWAPPTGGQRPAGVG